MADRTDDTDDDLDTDGHPEADRVAGDRLREELAWQAQLVVLAEADASFQRARAERAEARLGRLTGSRSWRWTRPLRRAGAPPAPLLAEMDTDARAAVFDRRMRAAYETRAAGWPERTPRSLNEKVRHRRLADRRDWLRTTSDKVTATDLIRQRVGDRYAIEILEVVDRADDLDTRDLPDEYVVKTAHGSGGVAVLWHGPSRAASAHATWFREVLDVDDHDRADLLRRLQVCLDLDFGWERLEWGYLDLPRRLVVQPRLAGRSGPLPTDLMLYAFAGRVEVIAVTPERTATAFGIAYYDRDWELTPIRSATRLMAQPRPNALAEMIEVAEALAAGQAMVRVDLLDTATGPKVCELTNYPAAGAILFRRYADDLHLGSLWPTDGG